MVTVNHQTCCPARPVAFPAQPRRDVTRVQDREREGAARLQEAIGPVHGAGQVRPVHQCKRGHHKVKRSIRQRRALGVGRDVVLYTERFVLFRLPRMSDEPFRQVDPGHSRAGPRKAARIGTFSAAEIDNLKAGYISDEPQKSRLGKQIPITVETRANIRCPLVRIGVPVGGDIVIGHVLSGHRFHQLLRGAQRSKRRSAIRSASATAFSWSIRFRQLRASLIGSCRY